jgi:hypothetical protein
MGTPRTLDARASASWLRRFVRTTPGVVGVIAIAVAAGCVIAGVVCGAQLNRRIGESHAVLDRSEPLAYSAQNLYAALSAADAAAASAFLSGGIETAANQARYRQALADAASALADATAGATDADTRTAMAEISAQLSAYTGLVESARANNRQGFPIGSGYLREASSLMRTALLPGAERIFTGNLSTLDEGQRSVGSAPTIGLALLVVVLATIGVGSVLVYRRTNRQFNVGLVVAAAAVVLAIAWIVVVTRLAGSNIEHSRTEGTARFGRNGPLATASRWRPTWAATTQPPLRRRSAPIRPLRLRSSPPSNPACATRSNTPAPRCATASPNRVHGWRGVQRGRLC